MKAAKTFRTALNALQRNKTRAGLSVLGIVIGIGAVITMMEIGAGSAEAVSRAVSSMGASNLIVLPGTASSGGVSYGAGSSLTLTAEDAEALRHECPALLDAAPLVRMRAPVIYQERNWVPSFVYGTTPDYLRVRGWPLREGTTFSDADTRNGATVCLLGETVTRELFGSVSPLGKEIRIQGVGFVVIGVLSRKGANAMGMDQDDVVLAPWQTVKYRLQAGSVSAAQATTQTSTSPYLPPVASLYPATGNSDLRNPTLPRFANIDQIAAAAKSPDQTRKAIEQIKKVLRTRHHLRPGEPDDFNIRDMAELASSLASTTGLMTNLLLAVALISLVVGGVGIMNIMLVSVTERTREIGLRMAIGARSRDILGQFLAEAIVLCALGGGLGVAGGRGASVLVEKILKWPVQVSMSAIVASLVVSCAVGLIFGFYPAWRAARLDPIEALRYE